MKTRASRFSKFLAVLFLAPLFAISVAGQAEEGVGAAVADAAVAIEIIVGIDKESRAITLKNEEGEEWVFHAGPEVRNFDQLKRGDLVIIEYYAGLALELGPKGEGAEKMRITEVQGKRAQPGEKPGMKLTKTTYATGEVSAIDKKSRRVTLQGAKRSLVLTASDEVDLSKLAVGQKAEALYIESFAVSVMPAPEVSGKVKITSTSVAIGIGVEWGTGTLTMYDGTTHDFKVSGLSVLDVGVSSVEAAGEVYGLVEAKDLEGSFVAGEAGGAFIGGGSASAMKNENGVVMKLKSTQKGVKLTLAGKGLTVELQ